MTLNDLDIQNACTITSKQKVINRRRNVRLYSHMHNGTFNCYRVLCAHTQVAEYRLTGSTGMLVGSRRFMTSSARYRAVLESVDAVTDDDKDYDDDDDDDGGVASNSYESFSSCQLMLVENDHTTASTRSHQLPGNTTCIVARYILTHNVTLLPENQSQSSL